MFSPQQLRQPKKRNHRSGNLPFRGNEISLKKGNGAMKFVHPFQTQRVPAVVQMCGTVSVKERLRKVCSNDCGCCSACGQPFIGGDEFKIALIAVKPFHKNGSSRFLAGDMQEVHVNLHSSCEMEISEFYFPKTFILGEIPKASLFPAGEELKLMMAPLSEDSK